MSNPRLLKLRAILATQNLDGFLVSQPQNVTYLSHLWGLTPEVHEAYLLITPKHPYLFTDGRYIEAAKKLKTGVKCVEIHLHQDVFPTIGSLVKKLKLKCLGFEKSSLTFAEYEALKKSVKQVAPANRLVATGNLVENLRAVKEPREIAAIKMAAKITDLVFTHLLKVIKPGLSEIEIAWEIEKFTHDLGASLAFSPIVASGPNSAIPHHQTGNRKFKPRDLVLLDLGVKVDHYCSDMTRVVFLGKATPEQKKVYQVVLGAQKLAIERLSSLAMKQWNNGTMKSSTLKATDIDRIARSFITSHGYPTIPHGLGHGVGLSSHEKPRLGPKSPDILKPGMVFTIEPGIYLPNKFGVRIEDLIHLTPTGPQILTQSLKEIIEL